MRKSIFVDSKAIISQGLSHQNLYVRRQAYSFHDHNTTEACWWNMPSLQLLKNCQNTGHHC